jgi:RNA polymerase sigma-70 factor (ECF subfamily)
MKSQGRFTNIHSAPFPGQKWEWKAQAKKMSNVSGGHDDTSRFCELTDPIRIKLFNYIHKSLNYSEVADDVYQETLIRAFKYFKSFRKDKSFATWIFAIAHNEIRKHLKNRLPSIQLDPETKLFTNSQNLPSLLVREIYDYAEHLKPKQREVFFLFYDNGFSIAEISRITGHSNSHIKLILHRARKYLRQKLGDSDEEKTTT